MRTVAFAVLAAAALFAPAATMAAASLDPASFSVDVVPGCPSLLECPPLHPGFLDQADFTDSVASVQAQAQTSPVGPSARAQGRVENIRSSVIVNERADAQVSYEVEVVPVGPGLAFQRQVVPVVIRANVGASDRTERPR